jgi:hypothetical protein
VVGGAEAGEEPQSDEEVAGEVDDVPRLGVSDR